MPDLPNPSTIRQGQILHRTHHVPIRTSTQEMTPSQAALHLGVDSTTVEPLDRQQSRVTIFDSSGLASFWMQHTSRGSPRLPAVLKSLSIVYENGGGDGEYIEVGTNSASGSGSISASVSGTAGCSSFSLGKVLHDIQGAPSEVDISHNYFYSATTDITTILSRLTTKYAVSVLAMPLFQEKGITLTLFGMKSNSSIRRSYQGSKSAFSSGVSESNTNGLSTQIEKSPVRDQIQIPATLHGAFSLTPTSTETHGATVNVGVTGVINGGGGGLANAIATASVTPSSISATSPTTYPTTGLYVSSVDVEAVDIYGAFLVHASVIDFSTFSV